MPKPFIMHNYCFLLVAFLSANFSFAKQFKPGVHQLVSDKKKLSSNNHTSTHLIFKIKPKAQIRIIPLPVWTKEDIEELEFILNVKNIFNCGTLITILISHKCAMLYQHHPYLYAIFVEILKIYLVPIIPHAVVRLPPLYPEALRALIDAGANPQPIFNDTSLIPALQYYISAGPTFFPSLTLLLEKGAKPDFIVFNGAVTAMDLILWEFWNNGVNVVPLLLRYKADPNLRVPRNDFPNSLPDKNHSYRNIYLGFFTGDLLLDMAVYSALEQYYLAWWGPTIKRYTRASLIEQCNDIIHLLVKAGGKSSTKEHMRSRIKDMFDLLNKSYGNNNTNLLTPLVNYYIETYGT